VIIRCLPLSRRPSATTPDGADQHIVLSFELSPPSRNASHPSALGGKLTVSSTGYVAGMILDEYDPSPHGTMTAERLAVWSMYDAQLQRLATVARDALAMRRAARALG
jgi:hypothetical protein